MKDSKYIETAKQEYSIDDKISDIKKIGNAADKELEKGNYMSALLLTSYGQSYAGMMGGIQGNYSGNPLEVQTQDMYKHIMSPKGMDNTYFSEQIDNNMAQAGYQMHAKIIEYLDSKIHQN